ncbi:MAG: type II secretion system protein GspG [Pseudohaliea sp.]
MRLPPTLLLTVTLLAGCASLQQEAQDAVIAALPSPHGTSFSDLRQYPGAVVCGRYTAPDLEGLRTETHDFIYTGGTAYRRPSAQQLALFCTTEPAAALERELGMGPWENGSGALGRIHADLRALSDAIAAHAAAEGDVPFGSLEELVPPSGAFLPALPKDPWGNAYRYEVGLGGRSQRDYRLYTLGADNRPGGTGADADVGREHLPYLDRLARL